MLSGKVYFVTGIDTDAGKSFATGHIARQLLDEGRRVVTQKFVQTGHKEGISEDILLHRQIMGIDPLAEDIAGTTCPVRFAFPASADLAARLEGSRVDPALIDRSTEVLCERFDTVLIEGAGGLMVPLDGHYITLDHIRARSLPVVVVANPKLGSVNHTLLTLEVCRAHGIEVAMLAYNPCPATSPVITEDTRRYLLNYITEHHPGCEFMEIPFIEIRKK